MAREIVPVTPRKHARIGLDALPTVIVAAGEHASRRFLEFFTANISNKNTRLAYARAVAEFPTGRYAGRVVPPKNAERAPSRAP